MNSNIRTTISRENIDNIISLFENNKSSYYISKKLNLPEHKVKYFLKKEFNIKTEHVWTQDKIDLLIDGINKNLFLTQISKNLNFDRKAVLEYAKKNNLIINQKKNINTPLTEEEELTVINLKNKGWRNADIAKHLQKTQSQITNVFHNLEAAKYKRSYEKWTSEENKELIAKNFNINSFCKKYERPRHLVLNKRNKLLKKLNKIKSRKIKKWTKEELRLLYEKVNKGLSYKEIHSFFPGRSYYSVARACTNYKVSNGLLKPKKIDIWTEDEVATLFKLKKEKFNCKIISIKMGRTHSSVRKKWALLKDIKTNERNKKNDKERKILKKIEGPKEKFYKDTIKKNFIQDLFYSNVNQKSSALVLLGPTPKRYFNILNKYILKDDSFIYSNEINFEYLSKQNLFFNKINFKRVNLTYGDIIGAEPQKFIDIDLMCKWVNGEKIIKNIFEKQSKKINGPKTFIFSISIFRDSTRDIPLIIKEIIFSLLKVNLEQINYKNILIDNNNSVKKYIMKHNSKYDIDCYTYSDTSPMLTISIKYEQ